MNETYVLFGWSILLTVAGVLFMVIVNGIRSDIKDLWKAYGETQKKCEDIMQHTHNMYVRRDDYLRFQDQILQSVQRIEQNINNLIHRSPE